MRKKGIDPLELCAKRDQIVGIKNMPKFRNEHEEAEWWDRNGSRITDFAVEHGLVGKRPAWHHPCNLAASTGKRSGARTQIGRAKGPEVPNLL
jgi:hypothetical protein